MNTYIFFKTKKSEEILYINLEVVTQTNQVSPRPTSF